MHVWWQRPMKTLEAMWSSLEELTFQLYQACVKECKVVPRGVIKGLVAELKDRQRLREQWDERRADKIYQRRISAEYRPVARPIFDVETVDDKKRLGKELTPAIGELTSILSKTSSTASKIESKRPNKKDSQQTKSVRTETNKSIHVESGVSAASQKRKRKQQEGTHPIRIEYPESQQGNGKPGTQHIDDGATVGRKKKKKRQKAKQKKLVT
jgi:hypothetical protein